MTGDQPNARNIAVSVDPDQEHDCALDPYVLPQSGWLDGDRVLQPGFHVSSR